MILIFDTSDAIPHTRALAGLDRSRRPDGRPSLGTARTAGWIPWILLLVSGLLAAPVSGTQLLGGGCASTSYFTQLRASSTLDLDLSTGGMLQAGAQRFEAPQALVITGFSFHAHVDPGQEVEVEASIYLPDGDGFPTGAPLATTSVTVDNGFGSLESMRHRATFDSSALVEEDYLLVVESDSATVLRLVVNDYTANDGQGEGLASLRIGGTWRNGLEPVIDGASFDADFLFQPDYVVVDFFVDVESASPCLQAPGTLEFDAVAAPIFSNRFYNADIDDTFTWLFGDGSEGAGATVQHTYDAVGPWTVRSFGTLRSGFGDSCSASGRRAFGSIPLVNGVSIVERFDTFEVTFSPNATGTEGWAWDFGDGTTSSAEAPRHFYPSLGFFTACVTTWNQCGTIPELCFEVLSPFPDISVVIGLPDTEPIAGSPLTYTVEVWNFSGAASGSQTLTHAIPEALTGASWTCDVNGTGSCSGAGTGAIADAIQLEPQTILTYTITGTYDPVGQQALYLFAEVSVPSGDETANNSAFAAIFAAGTLFADSFETGDTDRWAPPVRDQGSAELQ